MKKVIIGLSIWVLLCATIYFNLTWSKPKAIKVEEFIGWNVTYLGPSFIMEVFVEEFIPSYKHMPSAGYLHFTCKNGSVTTYLLWSRIIKVEEVYGSTSILSEHEVECVFGKESLRVPGIKIT